MKRYPFAIISFLFVLNGLALNVYSEEFSTEDDIYADFALKGASASTQKSLTNAQIVNSSKDINKDGQRDILLSSSKFCSLSEGCEQFVYLKAKDSNYKSH